MEVLRNGKFSLPISGSSLAKGLRKSKRNKRNTHSLTVLSGAVGRDDVLAVLDELDRIDTSALTAEFPYPQLFVLVNHIVVCTASTIYEYSGGVLTAKISVSPCTPWRVVDYYDYLYMSNAAVSVIREAGTNEYLASDLPVANAMCDFNGQVLISPRIPVEDNLFYLHGAPLSGGSFVDEDQLHKANKGNLDTNIWYGELGTGIDQMRCPWHLTVDDTYVYFIDVLNNRIMKRRKSDLTYVHHQSDYGVFSLYTSDLDDILWMGRAGAFSTYDKTALTIIDNYAREVSFCDDITGDSLYIYIADSSFYRVVWFDKLTRTYRGTFGHSDDWGRNYYGIALYGGYLYTTENYLGTLKKIDPSDYSVLLSVGDRSPENDPNTYFPNPRDVAVNASYVFVATDNGINIRALADLSFVDEIVFADNGTAYGLAIDSNYIYTTDNVNGKILKYDVTSPFAYVSESVYDMGYAVNSCAIDATHVYAVGYDGGDPTLFKLLLSNFAYVDEYEDTAGEFSSYDALLVDGTYVYVADNGNGAHRVNKSTMAYVDVLDFGQTWMGQMSFDGLNIYFTNYTGTYSIQHNVISTQALLDRDPGTVDDSDHMLMRPRQIAVDDNYIYVGTYEYVDEIKVYRKSTKAWVTDISMSNPVTGMTADINNLYTHEYLGSGVSHLKKWTNTEPFTVLETKVTVFGTGVTTLLQNVICDE